jgi:hypothetical protein
MYLSFLAQHFYLVTYFARLFTVTILIYNVYKVNIHSSVTMIYLCEKYGTY